MHECAVKPVMLLAERGRYHAAQRDRLVPRAANRRTLLRVSRNYEQRWFRGNSHRRDGWRRGNRPAQTVGQWPAPEKRGTPGVLWSVSPLVLCRDLDLFLSDYRPLFRGIFICLLIACLLLRWQLCRVAKAPFQITQSGRPSHVFWFTHNGAGSHLRKRRVFAHFWNHCGDRHLSVSRAPANI